MLRKQKDDPWSSAVMGKIVFRSLKLPKAADNFQLTKAAKKLITFWLNFFITLYPYPKEYSEEDVGNKSDSLIDSGMSKMKGKRVQVNQYFFLSRK